MTNVKKYNKMENILNEINGKFVSLQEEEKSRNNEVLREVIDIVVKKLKETDELFKALYETVFYGGSFYDGLKISHPDEYNLDLLLRLPKQMEPCISACKQPGFVEMTFNNVGALNRGPLWSKYKGIDQLYDTEGQLDTIKVIRWMQSIFDRALNCYLDSGTYILPTSVGILKVSRSHGDYSPAFTLKIKSTPLSLTTIKMDVDLSPCFVFGMEQWHMGFENNTTNKPDFFIVPKRPPPPNNYSTYWRLSFQQQERVLMDNKQRLKPALRLLKKLRDTQGHHAMKSYFLETIVLWELKKRPADFWNKPLSYVFMTLLESYNNYLDRKEIPYFWDKRFNLLANIDDITWNNLYFRIKKIIQDVNNNLDDPNTITKYLLKPHEIMTQQSYVQNWSMNDGIGQYENAQSTSNDTGSNLVGSIAAVGAAAVGAYALYRFLQPARRGDD